MLAGLFVLAGISIAYSWHGPHGQERQARIAEPAVLLVLLFFLCGVWGFFWHGYCVDLIYGGAERCSTEHCATADSFIGAPPPKCQGFCSGIVYFALGYSPANGQLEALFFLLCRFTCLLHESSFHGGNPPMGRAVSKNCCGVGQIPITMYVGATQPEIPSFSARLKPVK